MGDLLAWPDRTVALVSGPGERDAALRQLVERAGKKGLAIARDLLGDAAEAEDAVQESLARALASWERLREPAALEGWFYRVLTHVCLRHLRRRRLWTAWQRVFGPRETGAGGEAGEGGGAGGGVAEPRDESPAVDEALGARRDGRRLLAALGGLPAQQRAALVLRYGQELGVAEIAAMLAVSEATVKTHLVRGLARLRERMRERMIEKDEENP